MNPDEILAQNDLYDREIQAHGFFPFMRDYFLLVGDYESKPASFWRYAFRGCVEARYRVTLKPDAISFDDALLSLEASQEIPKFTWAVSSACSAEEGWECSREEESARAWSQTLSVPIWYARVGTNVYELQLWFHDVRVDKVESIEAALKQIWQK